MKPVWYLATKGQNPVICPSCGQSLKKTVRFCPACGVDVKQIHELLQLARIGVDTGRYARAQALLYQALKLDPQCQAALTLLQGVEERLKRVGPAVATPEIAAPYKPAGQNGTAGSRPMAPPAPRSGAGDAAQHLLPGEETIYRARPHWIILIAPLFILFAGLVCYGLLIRPFIGNDRYLAVVSSGVNAFFVLAAIAVNGTKIW